MKLCINSGCKHELDDYQERCPAIVMLLNWRKSGFLLLTISSIIGGLLAMLTSSFPIGLLGIVVWYFILQIKKDGKSCWEQLS